MSYAKTIVLPSFMTAKLLLAIISYAIIYLVLPIHLRTPYRSAYRCMVCMRIVSIQKFFLDYYFSFRWLIRTKGTARCN